ncbi:MAG: NERD domain-containing protein [Betaproteobacteria bacterium]|nr:NERD domain-containing protein [Betaproteobacteria bacterium]
MSLTSDRPKNRSPLRYRSLPQAGDGLSDALQDGLFRMVLIGMLPALLFGSMLGEWARYWFKIPPGPWQLTILFFLSIPVAAWLMRHQWAKLKNLGQGLHGERTVGQLLETLRAKGYQVFHDLQQERGNIDHTLIGPGGVFAIETKTISKPNDRDGKVTYDGQRLLVDGGELERDPVAQSLAVARGLRQLLKEQTGQDVDVTAVVLFPGWYVETLARDPKVLVANENYFLKSFDHNRRPVLDDTMIKLLSSGLEREGRSER